MGILFFVALPLIVGGYYSNKYQRLAIELARKECNRRFKHYYKYVL